jgi:muconate cycloisomerase
MRLKQIDLYRLQIQLSVPFKHNITNRTYTENLVVKVTTDEGLVGYGEGIPRQYVTGETFETSLRFLLDYLIPRISGFEFSGPADLAEALSLLAPMEKRAQTPAAYCALELAILDAVGKSLRQSLADMLGGAYEPLIYSTVIPMLNRPIFKLALNVFRDLKIPFVKIKVGNRDDLELLALARKVLGKKVDLRVDANGAWSAEEAEERIAAMMAYGISAVEQPVAKNDIQGLSKVAQRVLVPVIADESICSEEDALQLASLGACQVFNIRLSKCGGLLAAARIYEIARSKGIGAQLGCQVGETGILAAAGRHFAVSRPLLYLEGSYSKYLLEEDIVNEPVEFARGGVAKRLEGPGLGVSVNQKALQRLSVLHQVVRL